MRTDNDSIVRRSSVCYHQRSCGAVRNWGKGFINDARIVNTQRRFQRCGGEGEEVGVRFEMRRTSGSAKPTGGSIHSELNSRRFKLSEPGEATQRRG